MPLQAACQWGTPRMMLRSSCTPSTSLTSAKGRSTLTAAQLSEVGMSAATLMGGMPGFRCCANRATSYRQTGQMTV
jgi:hypothetical protein